jgi:hypothetical protein
MVGGSGLDLCGSGNGPVARFCEYGNERSCPIKGGGLLGF